MSSQSKLKKIIGIRGDSLYCPLPVTLNLYGNCPTDCNHCYLRRLNHVWGQELKPADPDAIYKKLRNGMNNKNPKSSEAWALSSKKTLRIYDKVDPFNIAEKIHRVTKRALEILIDLDWTAVIQTRNTEVMSEYKDILLKGKSIFSIQPIITVGLERDRELFEKNQTSPVEHRLNIFQACTELGFNTSVQGEPFIPGFHTVQDFEDALKLFKEYGVKSYNTYNFHFNDFVAKRLVKIPGVDIEKIWYYNQDEEWKKILPKLIDLCEKYEIDLGCPDFVNSGNYVSKANTCCGISVQNPSRFNLIYWKNMVRYQHYSKRRILASTWEGIGDFQKGEFLMFNKSEDHYSMLDIKW